MVLRCTRTKTNAVLLFVNLVFQGPKYSLVSHEFSGLFLREITRLVFEASKIASQHRGHGYDNVTQGVDESLAKWGLGGCLASDLSIQKTPINECDPKITSTSSLSMILLLKTNVLNHTRRFLMPRRPGK